MDSEIERYRQRVDELTLMLAHVWGCPLRPYACDHDLHEEANELVAKLQGRRVFKGNVHWETPTVETMDT